MIRERKIDFLFETYECEIVNLILEQENSVTKYFNLNL